MRVTMNYGQVALDRAQEYLQGKLTTEQHQKVFNRLMELGRGSEPQSKLCGICNDIDHHVFERSNDCGYAYCAAVFTLMGLHYSGPLDFDFDEEYKSHWEGIRGKERRQLCRDMAQTIERLMLL